MSEAQNKTITKRFNDEVWDKGDEAALDELSAEDAVDYGASPGQPPGREGHKCQITLFRSAFPDLQVSAEDIFTDGDKVAYRWTGRGTHQKELMGIAPSGKEVTFMDIDVLRIAGARWNTGRRPTTWGRCSRWAFFPHQRSSEPRASGYSSNKEEYEAQTDTMSEENGEQEAYEDRATSRKGCSFLALRISCRKRMTLK